jgi:hypothetical protein
VGTQVKVIQPSSANYRPPAGPTPPPASNTARNAAGQVQSPKLGKTGGATGSGGSAGLAPKPRANPTTGPTIPSPSVNYDANQETAPKVTHLGASGRDYADQQQQPVPDKSGA